MLKDADGAAVQQFAGHPDLLRQSHTRMLDQLDQLIRCQPAKGFCVLLVGHQRGFDYPGEIDAIVSGKMMQVGRCGSASSARVSSAQRSTSWYTPQRTYSSGTFSPSSSQA